MTLCLPPSRVGRASKTSWCTDGYSPGVGSASSGCLIVTSEDGPAPFYRGAIFVMFPPPHYDPCFGTKGWYSGYLSLRLAHSCSRNAGTVLTVTVTVPPNSNAITKLPLLGSSAAVGSGFAVTEGPRADGRAVWRDGAFVPGVPGVFSARVVSDTVEVRHGSGVYAFERRG